MYESPEDSFMAVPYFGPHPTGIVFNMDEYKLLKNRNHLFTKEAAYIHPHELILGRLAQYGEMFQFKKIWSLADTDYLQKIRVSCINKGLLMMHGFHQRPERRNLNYLLWISQQVLLVKNLNAQKQFRLQRGICSIAH